MFVGTVLDTANEVNKVNISLGTCFHVRFCPKDLESAQAVTIARTAEFRNEGQGRQRNH